jgi:hypothetical protein
MTAAKTSIQHTVQYFTMNGILCGLQKLMILLYTAGCTYTDLCGRKLYNEEVH